MAPEKLLAELFWTDRWIGSSAFLLPIEIRGLYREMLTQAWRRGAQLPNDHEAIRRAIGATTAEWKRCWPAVQRYWRVEGDTLVNDTQRLVYEQVKARMDRVSERGRRGAAARHDTNISTARAGAQALAQANGKHVLAACDPETGNRKPETRKEREMRASLSPPADPFADDEITERAGRFIEKYQALYPKHRNGARYAVRPARDYAAAVTLCQTWLDDARLEKLAICFLTTDHKFAAEGSRTIPQFLALASWADGELAKWEAGQR